MIPYVAECKALAIILSVALLAGLVVSATTTTPRLAGPEPVASQSTPRDHPTPLPAYVRAPLTGILAARDAALRRPEAVMVDDFFPDARPQPGISRASVVFETVVESGITRLMPVFGDLDAPRVGPIRSARPYFVAWAAGLRALFVHAGGSPASLTALHGAPQVGDIEALTGNAAFHRDARAVEPHNLFSGTAEMRNVASQAALNSPQPFHFADFAAPVALSQRGRNQSISLQFSTPTAPSLPAYNVLYRYSPSLDGYLRSQGGNTFVDRQNGQQVSATNVVVLTVQITPIVNDPVQRVDVGVTGSGPGLFFREGHAISGTWHKDSFGSALLFADRRGKTIRLTRGTTWIEAVPAGGVQYSGT